MCSFRTSTIRADLKRTLHVGLPLAGAQILQMSNGLVDAMVAGRLGPESLAAGGMGGSLWFMASLLCLGMVAGLSPTLARLIGQRRKAEVGFVFRQGIWLAVLSGAFATTVLLFVLVNLSHLPLVAGLSDAVSEYLSGSIYSLVFVALLAALRNLCEATSLTRPVLLVTVIGLLTNVLASTGLGLGLWGLPSMGLYGIGLATSLVSIMMTLSLLMFLAFGTRFRQFQLFGRIDKPQWSTIRPIMVLSTPIFLGMVFESGLFAATSVQMGMIGVVESASHQIAISAAGLCFMLPLGMSFGVTARVARAAEQRTPDAVHLRVVSTCILTGMMSVLSVLTLVAFRHQIASVYTSDPEVQAFAASLILLGAIFQFSDGAQIMLTGILRGLHDTKVPMLINMFSYWGVAFSLGIVAAHPLGFGAYGLWLGLILGLTVASVLLALRLRWQLRQRLKLHELR